MTNPKTIAYQEQMKEFEARFPFWKAGQNCMQEPTDESQDIKHFLTSSYLHQLEEEVKRLRGKKRELKHDKWCDSYECSCGWEQGEGFNQCLDSEIALCEEAIKEIKELR